LLRDAIESRLAVGDGAFLADEISVLRRESNPHMHLLEACLAWREIGNDAGWAGWVYNLVEVALSRFIDEDSGALGELFTDTRQPMVGDAGRRIEPGHQFEWAWLLLRCEPRHPTPLRNTALKLITIGNESGVRNGVAIDSLNDDFTVKDGNARLWPQTERLKAALLGAKLTDDPKYHLMAHAAATSLVPYLDTAVPGLWFDVQRSDGTLIDSPSPASTFYHLVGAIVELNDAC
jgi:mannose-6-phosphate isomerase